MSHNKLAYLFEAETSTGAVIKQTKEDRSILDPTKSAFYDVLQHEIVKFTIKGSLFSKYVVDLKEGYIEVNGTKLYPPIPQPVEKKFKLIWYKLTNENFNATIGSGKIQRMEPIGSDTKFYFGFEYKVKGKTHKFVIGID